MRRRFVVYPPAGSKANDTEISTHAYGPADYGTCILLLLSRQNGPVYDSKARRRELLKPSRRRLPAVVQHFFGEVAINFSRV